MEGLLEAGARGKGDGSTENSPSEESLVVGDYGDFVNGFAAFIDEHDRHMLQLAYKHALP